MTRSNVKGQMENVKGILELETSNGIPLCLPASVVEKSMLIPNFALLAVVAPLWQTAHRLS
jgi:hypothetical protein